MVASAWPAVKAPAAMWPAQAVAELVADGVLVDQAAADELAEGDGGAEQGVVAGPGRRHADAGGLAGQRSSDIAVWRCGG